jgi:hypothetical protein
VVGINYIATREKSAIFCLSCMLYPPACIMISEDIITSYSVCVQMAFSAMDLGNLLNCSFNTFEKSLLLQVLPR